MFSEFLSHWIFIAPGVGHYSTGSTDVETEVQSVNSPTPGQELYLNLLKNIITKVEFTCYQYYFEGLINL